MELTTRKSKKELNSLEQEILIQEQLMVANEINKLEHDIAKGDCALFSKSRRIRTTAILFSSIMISSVSLFIFIIFLLKDIINLTTEFQKFLLFFDTILIFILPFVSILSIVLANKIIGAKNEIALKSNIVMLRRLEKYYRFIKFDFDPEKYKVRNDDFVVDIDEAGNLVKYIRFYNPDGTITTRPFRDIEELKKFLEYSEDVLKLKELNARLNEYANSIDFLEQEQKQFNRFNDLDGIPFSKAVVERSTINSITLTNPNIDFWPQQYQDKVSKWYSKDEYIESLDFVKKLKSNLLHNSWANGNKVVVNTDWISKEFSIAEAALKSSLFKNYDITRSKSQADDVESYILMIKNLDMKKDPSLNWEDTIDPKDINNEKLISYQQRIKELEEKALELSKMQLEQEKLLKHGSKNAVIKVELVDTEEDYRDIFKNYNPYEGIEQEIKTQARRNKEIDKTKAFIIENDLVDYNFDDLSLKEIKQIVKEKQRESEELQSIRQMEANQDLVKLKNEIARVKGMKFEEKHLAFEKFQNDEFRWMYHDGEGNYFEADDNMQWNQVESPEIAFNERKLEKIKNLQKQYNNLQKSKESDFNDRYSTIIKVKEKVLLEEQNREKAELEKQNKEKIDQEQKQHKEKQKKKKTKYNNLSESPSTQQKNDNQDEYVETHPANESWLGEDNKYYYHDGNGNYFTTNENNEWVACERPKQNTMVNSTNLQQETQNNQAQQANQPYQDANGVWWYFDDNGNYYYGDENGEWKQYKGEQ